jgi:dTDP-4-amino-4,6-dideoxygalactose transaminase
MSYLYKVMKYEVPFIDYPKAYQKLKIELDEAYFRCMSNGDLIFRQDTVDLENNIARMVGKKYGVSCDSCTNAMYMSLMAYGIGKDDEVITVDHTYIATIDVVVKRGAIPVLIDIRDDFNINPDLIEEMITFKTRAIMPVHLNGRSCQMDKIKEIADKYRLVIINDNAQSLGAKFKDMVTGSIGETVCMSFYPAKILGSYGDGGMVCVDSDVIAKYLYRLRDHGELPSYLRKSSSKDNDIAFYGQNTLLDNLQAAFLNVKLRHFDAFVQRRREIAQIYDKELKNVGDLVLPPYDGDGYFDVFQNYVIRTKYRDKLDKFLNKNSIETLIKWYPQNYKQRDLINLHKFHLPKTDQISREVLSLPIYPELDDLQIVYVIDKIKLYFKNAKT